MKLLVPGDLEADLVERIRAVEGVEVLQPATDEARAEVVPTVEIVFGGISRRGAPPRRVAALDPGAGCRRRRRAVARAAR